MNICSFYMRSGGPKQNRLLARILEYFSDSWDSCVKKACSNLCIDSRMCVHKLSEPVSQTSQGRWSRKALQCSVCPRPM